MVKSKKVIESIIALKAKAFNCRISRNYGILRILRID